MTLQNKKASQKTSLQSPWTSKNLSPTSITTNHYRGTWFRGEFNRTQNPTEGNEILLAYLEEERKPNELWINTKTTAAIEFHLKHDDKKENLPIDQQIPEPFHDYLAVFDKEKAHWFPEPRPWDHKIELKEGF